MLKTSMQDQSFYKSKILLLLDTMFELSKGKIFMSNINFCIFTFRANHGYENL